MNEAEQDMKNYADLGGCYEGRDLHNPLHPMKAKFIN